MLLTLNDDCLLQICKYLDVYEHISLANTCQRLSALIQESYRNRGIETTDKFWNYFEQNEPMVHKFWNLINENLQKFVMRPNHKNYDRLLQNCRLPNLKHFSFSTVWIADLNMPLEALKSFLEPSCMNLQYLQLKHINWEKFGKLQELSFPKLTHLELCTQQSNTTVDYFNGEIFPKLTSLYLNGVKLDRGVGNLTNLTELVLKQRTTLSPQHIKQILLNLPLKKLTLFSSYFHEDDTNYIEIQNCYKVISECQTLEDLVIDYHHFCMFGKELAKLKNLRKLQFLPPSESFCACREQPMCAEILEHLSQNTKSLTIKYVDLTENWHGLQSFIQSQSNVKSLRIVFSKCKSHHISHFAKIISKNLKEFHFFGALEWSGSRFTSVFYDYSGFLNVLRYCRNIELYNLAETHADEAFLDTAFKIVRGNLANRGLPFQFCFNQTLFELTQSNQLALKKSCARPINYEFESSTQTGILCEF